MIPAERPPEPCHGRHRPEERPMIAPFAGWLPQVGGYHVPAAVYACEACGTTRWVPVGPPERVSA